ncbi:MAG: hypothetical protein AAFX99_13180 [Myxococcota bacterium]
MAVACSKKEEPKADTEQAAQDETKAPDSGKAAQPDAATKVEATKETAQEQGKTSPNPKSGLGEQLAKTRKVGPKGGFKPQTKPPMTAKGRNIPGKPGLNPPAKGKPTLKDKPVKPPTSENSPSNALAKANKPSQANTPPQANVAKGSKPPKKDNAPPKSPPATNINPVKAQQVADAKNTLRKRKLGQELNTVLTRNDVRSATGYRGLLRPGPLPGIEVSENYTSLRLRPSGNVGYGAGLQVWEIASPGYQTREFNNFLRQYPASKRSTELGDSAFSSSWGGVRYFVWLDRTRKLLIALTCDAKICKNDESLLKLARRINTNLPRVYKR